MLDIAFVVIVWGGFAAGLESVCIADHFGVEVIEVGAGNAVGEDDEAVQVQGAHSELEVVGPEGASGELVWCWRDDDGLG